MDFQCTLFVLGYILAFVGGFLVMLFFHLRMPEGTIVIEERPNEETDLFRIDMPLQLDEIKQKKKIVFDVKVEKSASSIMRDRPLE